MGHPYHLKYDAPAETWFDALPLGNGRLGAMVYGRADRERIVLNDDSLWYGTFMDRNNPALKEKLPEIRRLMFSGDILKAEELIMRYMVGSPAGMRRFTPLGQLDIALNQRLPFTMGGRPEFEKPEAYASDLDLMTGVLHISHTRGGVRYYREMFISHPARVMCVRYTSETPGSINLAVKMDRVTVSDAAVRDDRRPGLWADGGGWPALNADFARAVDGKTFLIRGRDSDVAFAAAVRLVCDGELINPVSRLLAERCGEVVMFVASSTSNRSEDPAADALARLDAAESKGYGVLREEHIEDFSALMDRCEIDLGTPPDEATDARLEAIRKGARDPAMAALYFQFSRYLIVSGGREDSSALNLQGIWNAAFMPMWDSKYTININLQMNYWLVEAGNLSELHMPLMDLMEKMHEHGRQTARVMYGMRGMAAHHNTDFYGDCAPQDWYPASTPWITGGAWLGLHVWEHYLYTKDIGVLKRMYPILKDMCLFYEDYLVEVDGRLLTCPSISPENRYVLPDGHDTPLCVAPAMDNQILRAFFTACAEIQKLIGVDEDYSETLMNMASRLPADQIGSKGQLLEWDKEYTELTPDMGHISHLFACYPGYGINWRDTPALMKAVNKSLELRVANGAGKGAWPLAWYLNINARLLDGEKTDDNINKMLVDSTSRSLLNARGVFQIDGNLGAAAGIAECLLQSHLALHFLPALPVSWKTGVVRGLVARGGREVDIKWEDGRFTEAVVRPRFDGDVEVVGEPLRVLCGSVPVQTEVTRIGFKFLAESGGSYRLVPVRETN